ncbi:hypothetical protein Vadar_022914 [Vaccinium darrowii]|uniref:Uncharacterized protein n=1 Tax=Vaccinium darrowii TaxID=229202 RepID=A0ACB7YYK6_9ERIC|nr:hypothetical protein Vadar_022914 [Vaccinium darrowii]
MGTPILFLLLSCVLITLPLATAQECPNGANFTTNSTYGQNRNRILSSLASNTTANGGFYNTTFTQGSDTIYALALCRGDLSDKNCSDCVDTASRSIIKDCPNQKEAFSYGDSSHCIVRCSDRSFFSTMDTRPARFVFHGLITDNVPEFDQALKSLVDNLVIRVTNGSSVGKFATGEIPYTPSKTVYGLVQCVPGLSSDDCTTCIRSAIDYYRDCCFRKSGVNIITPSCIFQYDSRNFFESSAGAAPPPPAAYQPHPPYLGGLPRQIPPSPPPSTAPRPGTTPSPPLPSTPPPPGSSSPPPQSTASPPVSSSPPPPSTDVETKGDILIFDGQECPNGANFTTNSPYGQNRNRILSSLASNTTANGGFFNTTFTQGSDTIYALALCRADLSDKSCSDCVHTASQSIIADCPNQKEAFNYGVSCHCIVRLSNQSFFNTVTTSPPKSVYITSDITDNANEFDHTLNSLVDNLLITITNGPSAGKFATGEIPFTPFKYIYGLVQCLPGLSSADCTACVRFAMDYDRMKTFRKWRANIVTPSCIFEYSFHESTSGAAPPPRVVSLSSPPPSTDVGTKGEDKGRTIQTTSKNKSHKLRIVVTVVGTSISLLLIGSTLFQLRIKNSKTDIPSKGDGSIGLPIFKVATIREATNNFSRSNKIGEGGFGPVFKGQLSTGQLIAVKRNSEKSNQGLREERMLIYEYMPNGSLNSFIFENRSNHLAWSRRFDIIVGIARGLLYLHRDSRLRIVHRDLKASNVLLDDQMNPKIADFGLARAFRGDQQLEKTGKVVGTYGYMSPEYVMDGLFSMKSDVYSFGVLVLEIVSGKRNREFFHPDHGLTLLGHAWKLWIEGKTLELVDEQMERSSTETKPPSSGSQSTTTNEMSLTVLSGR